MKKTTMTLEALEQALKLPEKWKGWEAFRAFKQTEFGVEALPFLDRLLDDKNIDDTDVCVVLEAIECIGKLGPKALMGESADSNGPRGLAAKLLAFGDHLWGYSDYKNCYSTALDALVKLGYTNKLLLQYIRKNLRLELDDDFIHSLTALKAIGTPEALSLLKSAAASRLKKLNKTYSKKVLAILAKVEPSQKIALAQEAMPEWHPFYTLSVKSGKLWVGDPHLPNADDGLVVKVPSGKYVVECDGLPRRCKAVSKLRVRLESAKAPKRGRKLGETGTDSATLGACEIAAFEAAYQAGAADQVQKAIESQTGDFGIIKVPKFPDAIMPFVPTGSDGNGPVFALMLGTKRVGVELVFMDE